MMGLKAIHYKPERSLTLCFERKSKNNSMAFIINTYKMHGARLGHVTKKTRIIFRLRSLSPTHVLFTIIIIISLFYEDNIFSTSTNLTYGPRLHVI